MAPLAADVVDKITQSVADNFDAQMAYTRQLIQLGGQRGDEGAAQDFVFAHLDQRGYAPVRFDMDEAALAQHEGAGRFSATHSHAPIVVGVHKPAGAPQGRSLILNGHIDVVPLGPVDLWTHDPYSAHIDGDRLYGRGAGDMRAGAAANLFALDALRRLGWQPAAEVIIQSVVEEESTGNGTLMTHLKGYKADAVIIPEPMGEMLVRAGVGVLWFQIEVRGTPVHVMKMGTGVNAIDACWRVVGALRELETKWNDEKNKVGVLHFENETHPLNFNTGLVNGGDWASSVPAWCRVDCRISMYPGTSAQSAAAEIEKRIADFSRQDPFLSEYPPKLTWNGFFSEGYVLEPGSEAEQTLSRAHRRAAGEELKTRASTAYLDARVHALYDKIPALVYGPISENFHGFDEWVSIESLKRVTTTIALFIAEWCGVETVEAR